MRSLYGDLFRYVICHNGLLNSQFSKIKNLNCECINQEEYKCGLHLNPPKSKDKNGRFIAGPAWKLYPPRLDINCHEIIIDNDVVIDCKSEIFDKFLKSTEMVIATEAIERSYGNFDRYVNHNLMLNTGVIGLPPGYDLCSKLNLVIDFSNIKKWENHFDEQGLYAATLQKTPMSMFSLSDINVCCPQRDYKLGQIGMHFIAVNNGHDIHWKKYKSSKIKLL